MNDIRPPGQQVPQDSDRESQGEQQSWGFVEREAEPQYVDHLQHSSSLARSMYSNINTERTDVQSVYTLDSSDVQR